MVLYGFILINIDLLVSLHMDSRPAYRGHSHTYNICFQIQNFSILNIGKLPKLKSGEICEKVQSGDDPPPLTLIWKLGLF